MHRHGHGDHHHDHRHHDHGKSGHDRHLERQHAEGRSETEDGSYKRAVRQAGIVVIRPTSGLSGDMMLTGLARMADAGTVDLRAMAEMLGLPDDCISLEPRAVNNVSGWGCRVSLPDTTSHRTWLDIRKLIAESGLSARGKQFAEATFALLAATEAKIHNLAPEAVHFHEVGALDSILDICLCAELFARLSPSRFVCGPLPLCDGIVSCDHGLLPSPAPAVFELLQGVPVRGIASEGETVTPTAIALLKGMGAEFGAWPEMTIERTALVYGGRILPGVPNGALFALGTERIPQEFG
ncbi:MAG: LarC family nickel insertion protein [Pseudorhodoplanes sp.]